MACFDLVVNDPSSPRDSIKVELVGKLGCYLGVTCEGSEGSNDDTREIRLSKENARKVAQWLLEYANT